MKYRIIQLEETYNDHLVQLHSYFTVCDWIIRFADYPCTMNHLTLLEQGRLDKMTSRDPFQPQLFRDSQHNVFCPGMLWLRTASATYVHT